MPNGTEVETQSYFMHSFFVWLKKQTCKSNNTKGTNLYLNYNEIKEKEEKKASLPGRLHGLSSLAIELISNSYTGVPLMVP